MPADLESSAAHGPGPGEGPGEGPGTGQSIGTLLTEARRVLADAGADASSPACDYLLAHVLGVPRSHLYAHRERTVEAAAAARFGNLIDRHASGCPVAYLTGRREFFGRDFAVDPATLVPRPETETLVETALAVVRAERPAGVLDLGTGSGAVAVSLAAELADGGEAVPAILATDASPAALAVARRNAARHCPGRVSFAEGSWFEGLAGKRFGLVVSNPPYVETSFPGLEEAPLSFEPRAALAAGPDGLEAIRAITAEAPAHLDQGGWLALEHGPHQVDSVAALFARGGFREVRAIPDLSGRPRVTVGRTGSA